MVINRAIVSTDINPLYYEFWPLVARAWRNIKIEPTAAVIGDLNLNYSLGTIIKVPLLDNIPSGFIAQVSRFIIPCFFPDEVSVIGDMDMIPLNRDYFTKKILQYNNDDILVFSADAYTTELRYPMCYIAAKGKYFQQIIGLDNLELTTIKSFIKDLFALNKNWDTDELFFAEQLHKSALLKNTIFLKRGGWKPYAKKRIDRGNWQYSKLTLSMNWYIDAHSVRPYHENINRLQSIVEYIDEGSVGKKYFFHLFKKPLRISYNSLKLLGQNLFYNKLYGIAKIISLDNSKNKIISFSLYGDDPRYTANLENTILSYQNLLPDWKCRVYTAQDVGNQFIRLLIDKGCEVIIMQKTGIDARYMYWRFLAIEDKKAGAIIIRDIDSLCTEREKNMIEQWISSDKNFHIIRDHVNHNVRMMGGLWGVKHNVIDIKNATKKFLMMNKYGSDQEFLKSMIYPTVKNDVMIHDSFPRFPDENVVVIPLNIGENFIGEINTDDIAGKRDYGHILQHYKKCFIINDHNITLQM